MAKLNVKATNPFVSKTARTLEGAPAAVIKMPGVQLRRLAMAHLLWEDNFYVDGQKAADILVRTVQQTAPETVAEVAIEAREQMKLRHLPLLLVRELARHPMLTDADRESGLVRNTVARVIQRPDELTELLSIYWKDGKQPLSAQLKKGIAEAFQKFDAYALAKYDRDEAVKLRDVMFLTHPKPGKGQSDELFTQVATRTLPTPDTWEVELSAGKDKRATFERLIAERKLGALAVLRNLRNMQEAGVPMETIREAVRTMRVDRVLPFRFIAAARHAMRLEPELEVAMFKCLEGAERLTVR